ncbi:inositol monophosphatase [Halorubrum sp. CBA1125]|nr:inositol monophosphatase [Halorubrum sp. CBA1125]
MGEFVESVARIGGREALSRFREEIDVENKADATEKIVDSKDIVTTADKETQRSIIEAIREEDPDREIVGEEEKELKSVPESGDAWIIDPIDGTYNYNRGDSYWMTSVAVVEDGKPIAAANIAPALGDIYVSEPGGTTRNGKEVTVTDHSRPEHANVATTVSPSFGSREAYSEGVADTVRRFGNTRRYGTAQFTLTKVAAGVLDGVVAPGRIDPWDSVAGVHLIEQAGGRVTDFEGNPWRYDSQGLVASNGEIHQDLLRTAAIMG